LKKTRFRHFFYHFFTPPPPFLGNQRPQQRNPSQRRWKTRRGKRGGQPRRGYCARIISAYIIVLPP